MEADNRQDTRKSYKHHLTVLSYPKQPETVEPDAFFPTVKYYRGKTCSNFFVETTSGQWSVYIFKSKHTIEQFYRITQGK